MSPASATCTVAELLPKKFDRMEDAVREQMATDQDLEQYRLPGFAGRMLASKATQSVLAALNKSVFLVLPAAWSQAPELAEYGDPKKHPPEEDTTLFLGEHEFEIEYKPVVNLRIASFDKPFLKFKLLLVPQIRAASITIRNGCIVSIGECDGSVEAELRYLTGVEEPQETALHTKLKSRDIKLVDPVELEPPGFRIMGDTLT